MKIVRLILTTLAVFSSGVLSAEPFTLESKGDGAWSDAATWQPERQPKAGDKVQIGSGHTVVYDSKSPHLIPLLHIEGALVFARDLDTELNVAVLKVGGGKEAHSGVADVHGHKMAPISYARFAHLGKENILGRYPIHFHQCRDSLRGESVVGVAIVDSHNRWVTIHNTL